MDPPLQNGFDASPYYRVGELYPHQQGNLLVIRLPGSQSEPAVPHASKNLASGLASCPQCGQLCTSRGPHTGQKLSVP